MPQRQASGIPPACPQTYPSGPSSSVARAPGNRASSVIRNPVTAFPSSIRPPPSWSETRGHTRKHEPRVPDPAPKSARIECARLAEQTPSLTKCRTLFSDMAGRTVDRGWQGKAMQLGRRASEHLFRYKHAACDSCQMLSTSRDPMTASRCEHCRGCKRPLLRAHKQDECTAQQCCEVQELLRRSVLLRPAPS